MGFLKNLKEQAANRSIGLEELPPDLQECLNRFEPKVLSQLLGAAGPTGIYKFPNLPEGEPFVAVLKVVRTWDEGDYNYRDSGVLSLTPRRLIWSGAGEFEVSTSELKLSGIRTQALGSAGQDLLISTGQSSDGQHTFDVGGRSLTGKVHNAQAYEYFVAKLKEIVETSQVLPGAPASNAGEVSQADELAKFAKLRDDGVITEDEFATKKSSLLGL